MSNERTSRSWFEPTGRTLLICLGIYFGLHVLTRSLVSQNLQIDEAEQLIFTQDWAWGYGSQPPLYNWMQKIFFSVFGLNVFALSVLKNSLLWIFYAFFFLSAREILKGEKHAVLATASVFFIPQIVWESQRDQTHLVLATACSAATLYLFVRICKGAGALAYLGLGLAAGCGVLSKYNYVFLLLALFGATVSSKFRGAILNRKMVWTFVVFAVATAPHFDWLIHHKALATSQSYKFKLAESGAWVYGLGIWRLAKSILGFLIVPTLVYSLLLGRLRRVELNDLSRWLRRVLVIGLLMMGAVVIGFHVTYVRDRWLQPLLFAYPILIVSLIANLQMNASWERPFFRLAGVVGVMVLIAMNGVVLGANRIHRPHNLNIPFAELASELKREGFDHGAIVAENFLIGGNLKMRFKESRVIVPGAEGNAAGASAPALVVWHVGNETPDEHFLDEVARVWHVSRERMTAHAVQIACQNGSRKVETFEVAFLKDALVVDKKLRSDK